MWVQASGPSENARLAKRLKTPLCGYFSEPIKTRLQWWPVSHPKWSRKLCLLFQCMRTTSIIETCNNFNNDTSWAKQMVNVLSVATTKYPVTIGAAGLVSEKLKERTKKISTVIVQVNDSQSGHSAFPFRHDQIGKVEFNTLNQVVVSKRFSCSHGGFWIWHPLRYQLWGKRKRHFIFADRITNIHLFCCVTGNRFEG